MDMSVSPCIRDMRWTEGEDEDEVQGKREKVTEEIKSEGERTEREKGQDENRESR